MAMLELSSVNEGVQTNEFNVKHTEHKTEHKTNTLKTFTKIVTLGDNTHWVAKSPYDLNHCVVPCTDQLHYVCLKTSRCDS